MLGRLKSSFVRTCQHAADRILAASAESLWQSPPRHVCNRIIGSLGVTSASAGVLGGDSIAQLSTHGDVTFVGPAEETKWGCSPARIDFLRESMKASELLRSVSLSDAHIALLHNLIVRYATEFSAYPFSPSRTLNLRSGDTFLDIGSFRGYVAVKAAHRVGTEGIVYAIEPMAQNFVYLQAHRDLNNLGNIECLQSAVSTEDDPDVQFYTTENQANACILDHLAGPHQEVTVGNLSAQSLAERVLKRGARRVIASITTNGTETRLAQALAECFVDGGLDYTELTIPIIYTQSQLPGFLESMQHLITDFRVDYPWLTLIQKR